MKRQPSEWEQIKTNETTDNGLISKIYKQLIQLSTRKTNNPSCLTLCDPMNSSKPGLPVHHQLPEFTQTCVHRSVMPSSHLILCRPLLLLPPIPHRIRGFYNESTLCMSWPKYWSFSFSISPSNEHSTNAINFPLSTDFTASHILMFYFHFPLLQNIKKIFLTFIF